MKDQPLKVRKFVLKWDVPSLKHAL
jgi:hypothetical protein